MTKKLRKEKERDISIRTQEHRESQNRMCGNKKAFPTEFEAFNAGKFGLRGRYFRTYACPVCGKWHITTKAKI